MRNSAVFKKDKSFTLIELLVGISIISLISSIILVNLKGPTEKAKIVKSLKFGQTINNALGAEAIGIWNFNEGNGGTVNDGSGYGNTGTISGASFSVDTPQKLVVTGAGSSLSFDGNDYVEMSDSTSLNLPSQTGEITIEAWGNAYSLPTCCPPLVGKGSDANCDYELEVSQSQVLNFRLGNGTSPTSQNVPIPNFEFIKWRHYAVTFVRNTKKARFYIDGNFIAERTFVPDGLLIDTTNKLRIGNSSGGWGGYWAGLIDDVRIYSLALSSAEIQKHYVEGLKTHQDLVIK